MKRGAPGLKETLQVFEKVQISHMPEQGVKPGALASTLPRTAQVKALDVLQGGKKLPNVPQQKFANKET
jgi:hypothetical protein